MANEESFILNHDPYIKITVTYGRDAVDNPTYDLMFPYFYNKTPVIGFDAEWIVRNPDASSSSKCAAVHLCSGSLCRIIKFSHFSSVPQSLVDLLCNPNITFVGFGINDNVAKLEKNYGFGCKNAVELAPLAAEVMKSPRLKYCGVDEVAFVVNRLDLCKIRSSINSPFQWSRIDHKERAKTAAVNVYAYYKIGSKLLAQDWKQ